MSVYRRMIGRELPCTLSDLLDLPILPLEPSRHEEFAALAQLGQADHEALCQLGASHLSRRQWGSARKRLIESLLKRPGNITARLLLAATCENLGQHDEAAAHLDAILAVMIAQNADSAGGWSRYALLCAAGFELEREGKGEQATSRYVMALSSGPTDLLALHRLTALYLTRGHMREAAAYLREILRIHPQDQAARICLGHVLQAGKSKAGAVWEYEQAMCLEPDTWELPLEIARQLQLMEDPDDAIGLLEKLIGTQPHFPDLRMRLGNMYSRRGEDDLARAEYTMALSLHPEYLDCHIAVARHELRMGRVNEACDHLRIAIAINDQNVEACAGLALALNKTGRKRRAKETLSSAARIGNNSAVLMAQLALVEADEAAAEGAVVDGAQLRPQWIAEQIERDQSTIMDHPSWTDVRVRQAMLMRMMGRENQAAEKLGRIAADEPTCTDAWMQMGLAMSQQKAGPAAFRAVERAIQLQPTRATLEYQLSLIYCGEMEFESAMERLEATDAHPIEVQRRVWTAIEDMQLAGLRRTIGESDRSGIAAGDR